MKLDLDRFQRLSLERLPAFGHEVDNWSLLEWAGAAAGELGEAANICKKLRQQEQGFGGTWAARDPGREVLLKKLGGELGDVLAYLSLLASAAGLDLGECAARKFDFISEAVGWDGERLSEPTDVAVVGEVVAALAGQGSLPCPSDPKTDVAEKKKACLFCGGTGTIRFFFDQSHTKDVVCPECSGGSQEEYDKINAQFCASRR